MRSTFGGLSYGGAPVYNQILDRTGSGTLTFSGARPAATVTARFGGRGKLSFPGNTTQFDSVAVRVMAITSGIPAASQRYAYQADLEPAGANFARSGVLANGAGGGDLVKLSALQARVTAFQAFVSGATGAQPGYIVTNDEDTVLTFDAGNGINPRIDLVVVRVRDSLYDGSGTQTGTVEVVKGTPATTPAAPAAPVTSVPLWQVLIPAAADGAVGVNFETARTDLRPWTTGTGGVLPVASAAERDTLTAHAGMSVWRTDTGWREIHSGVAWRVKTPVRVPNVAALSWITHPFDGQTAVSYGDNDLLQYDQATLSWVSFVKAALPYGQGAWPTYVPTLTQSTTVAKVVTAGEYTQTGRIVTANVRLDVTATGTPNAPIKFGLPVTGARSSGVIGRGHVFDQSANVIWVGAVVMDSATVAKFVTSGATDYLGTSGSPFSGALSSGDGVSFAVRYEAA